MAAKGKICKANLTKEKLKGRGPQQHVQSFFDKDSRIYTGWACGIITLQQLNNLN